MPDKERASEAGYRAQKKEEEQQAKLRKRLEGTIRRGKEREAELHKPKPRWRKK